MAREEQRDQTAPQVDEKSNQSNLDESEIEKQHQFQMFPTPDEKFASKVITELDD